MFYKRNGTFFLYHLLCRHGRLSFTLISFSTAFIEYASNEHNYSKKRTKTDEFKELFVELRWRNVYRIPDRIVK